MSIGKADSGGSTTGDERGERTDVLPRLRDVIPERDASRGRPRGFVGEKETLVAELAKRAFGDVASLSSVLDFGEV